MEPYKVRLDVFEGPLDLLLHLVRRDEVDIYDISLERLTRQFIDYLHASEDLDLDHAGEFVSLAAYLIHLKSRALLPAEDRPPEDEPEEADPRWELIRQLLEYKRFKDIADQLRLRALAHEDVFSRLPPDDPPELPPSPSEPPLGEISLLDLLAAFQRALGRARPTEKSHEIGADTFTVAEKMEAILRLLPAPGAPPLPFTSLFPPGASRLEMAVTFLALLELTRLRHLLIRQETTFGEIILERRTEESADEAK